MGKIVLFLFFCFNITIFAKDDSIYTLNCVSCHKNIPVSLDKYFYRYLLKYSSETEVKKAIFTYLKKPTKRKTIMPDAFIDRFGIKKKSNLSDKNLQYAIDTYWNKYKIFGKLK